MILAPFLSFDLMVMALYRNLLQGEHIPYFETVLYGFGRPQIFAYIHLAHVLPALM